MRIPVRMNPRPRMMRYITHANPNPSTSSMATLNRVMMSVVEKALHQMGSVITVR